MVDFGQEIPHEIIIKVLEDQRIRKSWDKRVKSIKIKDFPDPDYSLSQVEYSGFKLEVGFLEVRKLKTMEDETRWAYFSVENVNYLPKKTRGHTYFGFNRVFKTKRGTTGIEILSQSDYKMGKLYKFIMDKSRALTGSWLKDFKSKVLELNQNGNS